MEVSTENRKLGITFDNGQAEVLVWAPNAKALAIRLQAQTMPLILSERGYWTLKTPVIKVGDSYSFIIDEGNPFPDPASLSQPEGVHGSSVAVDTASFKWTDSGWTNLPLEDYVIYELHVGTFTPEGDFKSIESKLSYLKSLGITAIELMPVAQFPGSRNWGYDGVYPFAVQQSYGGPTALQQLVDACHSMGLAVILDVVYNHIGPEGNYLPNYGPYFTHKYNTPWGDALNFDDAGSDEVRSFFVENVLMWLRDFHIDALRLDAVHAIKDFSPKHILREIRDHVDDLNNRTGRNHQLIVECDLNDTRYINTTDKEGYGMDAQWIDEFHHALRVAGGNERNGYYADFNGLEHLAKAYKDAYVYDGQYSEHRQKTFGVKAFDKPGKQFIVFSQNHDQVGNRMLGERSAELVGFEMAKLMAGAIIVSPYLPMLFMGEEWAETNPFLYFVSHTDAELAEAVRKGRKAEFEAFHTMGSPPDPMADDTFSRSKLQWHLLNEGKHKFMHAYYTTLLALRKSEPALHNLDRKCLDVQCDAAANTLTLHRSHASGDICCVMNFSKEQREIILSGKGWKKVLNSADKLWGGPGVADALQPESLTIYKRQS